MPKTNLRLTKIIQSTGVVSAIVLYRLDCWMLIKEQMLEMETAEMHFLRAVARYKMADHKRNEVVVVVVYLTTLFQHLRLYSVDF
jgi:hypothetical protein